MDLRDYCVVAAVGVDAVAVDDADYYTGDDDADDSGRSGRPAQD